MYFHNQKIEKIKNDLGKNLLKIAELSCLKYNFDSELEIMGLESEVSLKLWEIVKNKKINIEKIRTGNSIYNYLLLSAKRIAIAMLKKKNRRKGIVNWERLTEDLGRQYAINLF